MERLYRLTLDILEREILNSYFQTKAKNTRTYSTSNIGLQTPQQSLQTQQVYVYKQVHNIVLPIVQSAIKNTQTYANNMEIEYSKIVYSNFEELLHKEEDILAFLQPVLVVLIEDMIYELKYDICKPILNKIYTELCNVYISSTQHIIYTIVIQLLPLLHIYLKESVETTLQNLNNNIEEKNNFLLEIYQLLWKFQTEILVEIEDKLELSQLTSSSIYIQCYEDIQTLARNAIYTIYMQLISLLDDNSGVSSINIFDKYLEEYIHNVEVDAVSMFINRLKCILRDAMEAKVQVLSY
jgi:hypothetical protein